MAIDPKDPRVQEFLRTEEEAKKKQAEKAGAAAETPEAPPGRTDPPKKEKEPKITGAEKKQHGPFKKTRAGVVLTKDEVKAIKAGRKKLRKELRQRGIRSKREFELTAGTLGLYFDKRRGFLLWFRRHWLGAMLGALLAMLAILFFMAVVTQIRGFFTINLSRGMFREGFTLSDTVGFEYPTTQLLAVPAQGVPCISINQIPENVDDIDGEHNDNYFAYTFYIRNEGDSTVDYAWRLHLNAESKNASTACWCIVFEDGEMRVYAKPGADGSVEALPAFGDNSRGFTRVPLLMSEESDQLQLITSRGALDYYRVVPESFVSDKVLVDGVQRGLHPDEVHKYTVVLWIEGDDPQCDDSLVGAYLGARMDFQLEGSSMDDAESGGLGGVLRSIWDNLRFWDSEPG